MVMALIVFVGYLMTEYTGNTNHHRSTFECVDAQPEYINGHFGDTNGALFYFIKPDCEGAGTIAHCPPYVKDRQLTCVICTK